MTENLANPSRPHLLRGLPAAAVLVVALSTFGWGATDKGATDRTEGAPDRPLQVRSAGDDRASAVRGGPFDVSRPTIGNLDPDLLDAVQAAAREAQDDGVRILVTSGWRSRAHQERLFAEAVAEYGSEEEARRHVSTPDTSAHVTGDAVDIGPTDAAKWLDQHGAAYGLCRTYANEIWHFELATTPGGRCPDMLPDAGSR